MVQKILRNFQNSEMLFNLKNSYNRIFFITNPYYLNSSIFHGLYGEIYRSIFKK
jgi:hypothetical protein